MTESAAENLVQERTAGRRTARRTAAESPGTRLYAPRRFTRRSRQSFVTERTRELLRHLGREASVPEKIIVSRVIAVEFELRRQDAQLAAGLELSGHAMRARLAAENRLRLDLAALGLRPTPPRAPTLEDIARDIAERKRTAALEAAP